ncbi:hypothetical protein F1559_001419 [Cyanidiococcus yangmingshanensis]|uniref:ABC transmembrane type-1 domain-containing protein n=1 Tax=Cyanidiococcus yangmingshanensis TaxID=2690220 RepID=A0A7J7IIV0_9RHOD|nr:hypothetical protein F1559_001419 [Cyanidiococcus yangmingshanensis]
MGGGAPAMLIGKGEPQVIWLSTRWRRRDTPCQHCSALCCITGQDSVVVHYLTSCLVSETTRFDAMGPERHQDARDKGASQPERANSESTARFTRTTSSSVNDADCSNNQAHDGVHRVGTERDNGQESSTVTSATRRVSVAEVSGVGEPHVFTEGMPSRPLERTLNSEDRLVEEADIAVAETAGLNDLTIHRVRTSQVREEALSTAEASSSPLNGSADLITTKQSTHPERDALFGKTGVSTVLPSLTPAASAYFQYHSRQAGVTDYHRYAQDQMRMVAEAAALTATGGSAQRKQLPELEANWLSRWTFWWFGSLIWRGWRRPLDDSDLYELAPDDRAQPLSERFALGWADFMHRQETRITQELARERARLSEKSSGSGAGMEPKTQAATAWDEEEARSKRRSRWPMFWVILRVHTRIIVVSGILKFFDVGLGQISPVFLNKLLVWLETPGAPNYQGYLWALAIFLTPFLKAFVENQYFYLTFRLAVRIRGEVQSAVYDKSLRLSSSARAQTTTGEVVNHMQLDAQRLSDFMQYAHVLWAALLQIGGALALLVVYLGYSGLIGFVAALLTVPLQGYLVKRLSAFRRLTFGITDRRVKLLNEMFQGIKALKFYAWEDPFAGKVTEIREQELAAYRRTVLVRTLFYVVLFVTPVLVSAVTFGFYGGVFRNQLNPAFIFAGLSVLNNLRFPLIQYPFVFTALVDARIGVQRLQRFFALDEIEPRVDTGRMSASAASSSSGTDPDTDAPAKRLDEKKMILSAQSMRSSTPQPEMNVAPEQHGKRSWLWRLWRSTDQPMPLTLERVEPGHIQAVAPEVANTAAGSPATWASARPNQVSFESSSVEAATGLEQSADAVKLKGSLDGATSRDSTAKLLSGDLVDENELVEISLDQKERPFVIEIEHGCFDWTLASETGSPASQSPPAAAAAANTPSAVQSSWTRRIPLMNGLLRHRKRHDQPPTTTQIIKPVNYVPALEDVNIRIPPRALVAIVGRVGSGKSSLVYSILGELFRRSGSVHVHGSIAYSAQAAWIYNGTVRDNILFGSPYESKRYPTSHLCECAER